MVWGPPFGIVHIITLIIAVAINVGLYFILRNRTPRTQILVLGILSLWGIASVIYDLTMWNSPLEYLPLHMCSINSLVIPFAVFSRNKVLNNLLLFWALGAFAALVVTTAQTDFEIFGWTFAFYYFPHVVEVGIPILMLLFKLTKKDVRCIASTVGITFGVYTIVHFINIGLNNYIAANNIVDWKGDLIQVNYMYSIFPPNPVLQLFYDILPYEYWYMLLTIPIILIYHAIVYAPEIIALIKSKRAAKAAEQ